MMYQTTHKSSSRMPASQEDSSEDGSASAAPSLAAQAQPIGASRFGYSFAGPSIQSSPMHSAGRSISAPDRSEMAFHPIHTPIVEDQHPVQLITVKKNKARSKGAEDYYTLAEPDDADAVDTSTLALTEREKVRNDLQKKATPKVKLALAELDKELASIKNPVDEKEIIAITSELDTIVAKQAINAKDLDKKRLAQLTFRVLNALEYLGNLDEGE